jgi:hypothetical protein
MCVIFWAEKGEFEISHVFEVLRFELPRRRVLANVSAIISGSNTHEATVGVAHRRAVEVTPALSRWHKYGREEKDWAASVIGALYRVLRVWREGLTLDFGQEQMRSNVAKVAVPESVDGFAVVQVQHECKDLPYSTGGYVPFTPFVFNLPGSAMCSLFSFDISIEGTAFDNLVDLEIGCSVDGAAILKNKILNEDLPISSDRRWHSYFEEHICAGIVKPARYDTMITNGLGALPTCYRLCNRTRRELIEDEHLNRSVAWFTSEDPNQDFIIELEFANESGLSTEDAKGSVQAETGQLSRREFAEM